MRIVICPLVVVLKIYDVICTKKWLILKEHCNKKGRLSMLLNKPLPYRFLCWRVGKLETLDTI
jgi:hypothetical protein